MDSSCDIETTVRWRTFLSIIVCSVFGLAVSLAKWREFRRPLLPHDSTLAMLQRYIEVEDFDAVTEHGMKKIFVAARGRGRALREPPA